MQNVSGINYSNLKRLSDMDLIKQMLSPHISRYHMKMLERVFSRRLLNPVEAEAIEDGATITVQCCYQFEEGEERPAFSFVAELLSVGGESDSE